MALASDASSLFVGKYRAPGAASATVDEFALAPAPSPAPAPDQAGGGSSGGPDGGAKAGAGAKTKVEADASGGAKVEPKVGAGAVVRRFGYPSDVECLALSPDDFILAVWRASNCGSEKDDRNRALVNLK